MERTGKRHFSLRIIEIICNLNLQFDNYSDRKLEISRKLKEIYFYKLEDINEKKILKFKFPKFVNFR